jgi:hypothetical protein
MYRGYQIGPSMSLTMDNVNFIFFPWQYAKTEWPGLWKDGVTVTDEPHRASRTGLQTCSSRKLAPTRRKRVD